MGERQKPIRWRALPGVIAIAIGLALGAAILGESPSGMANTAASGEAETMAKAQENGNTREAIFAGGCFWCIEAAFQLMPGVVDAVSGYTGGTTEHPKYEQVLTGRTGHFEAVRVTFDPEQISYEALLDQFWRSIDPTDAGGQFYDRGSQYSTAIFYLDEEQRVLAEASKQALADSGMFDDPIATQILPAQAFYLAEEYHQDYFEKYLAQYKSYSKASGREDYLEETWGE